MLHLILFLVYTGCKKYQIEDAAPIVQGHRISRHSVSDPFAALGFANAYGYPSIELDISLTKDRIPVLYHDYWINMSLCIYQDGAEITERVLIRDHHYAFFQKTFRCEETIDHVESTKVIVSLQEFLDSSLLQPETLINLDIKYDERYTLGIRDFTAAIIDVINAHPERFIIISASSTALLQSLREKTDVPLFLDVPHFASHNHPITNILIAFGTQLQRKLGLINYARMVKKSRADGISLPYQLIDRQLVQTLKNQDLLIQVWTPNSFSLLERFCHWPIDILISDYPERAACFDSEVDIQQLLPKGRRQKPAPK